MNETIAPRAHVDLKGLTTFGIGGPADGLVEGVDPASIETVVDAMAGGARVIWH